MKNYDDLPDKEEMSILIDAEIDYRYDVLLEKYIDLMRIDEYDELDTEAYKNEIRKFTKKIVFSEYDLSKEDLDYASSMVLVKMVDKLKEKGHSMMFFSHEEACDFSEQLVKDKYDMFLECYLKHAWREDGEIYIDGGFEAFVKKFVEEYYPDKFEHFKEKHVSGCVNQICVCFHDLFDERGDARFVQERDDVAYDFSYVESGEDYEDFIQGKLEENGFEVETTPVTGDQGVDLIARKNYLSIAIQCKFWQEKVGNHAVQEVFAGSKYYGTVFRCVVAPNGYTSAAKDLADKLHVYLLSEDDMMETLDSLFSID